MKSFTVILSCLLLLSGASALIAEPHSSCPQGQELSQNTLPPTNPPTAPPNMPGHSLQWQTDFSQAKQQAANEQKPLLLFFTGSDWCGWCKKIEQEVFGSPEFIQRMGQRFVFVMLDFPMNKQLSPEQAAQNNALKQQYGVSGYPTIILLDPHGNFVGETGYRPGGGRDYIKHLQEFYPSLGS